jgi:hypothetical protein
MYQKINTGKSSGNKYGAKKTEYNGRTFDSKKEAQYAAQLDMLRNAANPADRVTGVQYQVPMPLAVDGKQIGKYILDFEVTYADGRREHVDVKGMKSGCAYQFFKWKKKHVKAQYGIDIIEV